MNCPRCDEGLAAESQAGLELDRCSTCGGVWLDKGEDEALTRPEEKALAEHVAGLDSWAGVDDSPLIRCPRCAGVMKREIYAASRVEIDRCDCGVWLDKGELEKIAAYRTSCLQQLTRGATESSDQAEDGLDFDFAPDVLERSFARLYFRLGRSE